ncbi:ninjurin-1-like isoform X1 [Brachionus plicatilis]|uniref:Ninjurin-1-like isoform X1 n=1 Tax=Brachionus plicatilis TaxID=10195 RepID=A0A3M7R0B0_BRAPC|nr:ninjurin-1-like isoform X1 [Brachionus plicatilis]
MSNKPSLDKNSRKSEIKSESDFSRTSNYTVKNKEAYIHMEDIKNKFSNSPEFHHLLDAKYSAEFTDLTNIFNAHSTKKTFTTGLLDLALIATNFTQMKQLIMSTRETQWHVLDLVLMFSICISLILQILCGIFLVFSTTQEDFNDKQKRSISIKNNHTVTLFVLSITVVNIFINVFLNI